MICFIYGEYINELFCLMSLISYYKQSELSFVSNKKCVL